VRPRFASVSTALLIFRGACVLLLLLLLLREGAFELSNTSKISSPESRKKATLWENVESASPPVAPAR
jgi:hypothetical protein